jgi:leucyl/phenylalanyl-tRNA--protein transferase
MTAPYLIDSLDPPANFPPVELACRDPNGLLAVGGDLSLARLLSAYKRGIFPWYNEDQPILWWSPNPRAILYPQKLRISRSLRKTLKSQAYKVTMDTCFRQVIEACAQPRAKQSGTWILPELIEAYSQLHELGYAHSVETWYQGELVGGLYGVTTGRIFCGESMFSIRSDASKVALVILAKTLLQRHFLLIDCQMDSSHLRSLGCEFLDRAKFIELLIRYCDPGQNLGKWNISSG